MKTKAPAWQTLLVWTLHAACVAAALAFAGLFLLMVTSLDPLEMVNAGLEPWTNALVWVSIVIGVTLLSAVGLLLWHSRLRPLGLVLLIAEIGGLIWAGLAIYGEYF